jgi:hypothetical protein
LLFVGFFRACEPQVRSALLWLEHLPLLFLKDPKDGKDIRQISKPRKQKQEARQAFKECKQQQGEQEVC